MIRVYVVQGRRKTFASALDWPGWSRSGRDEAAALSALAAYAARYRPVAARAGFELPQDLQFEVVERVPGSGATDFGVPDAHASFDSDPLGDGIRQRLEVLVDAARAEFEETARNAPEELRKGPRGGGRNTSKIVQHVADAEAAYARTKWPFPYRARRRAWHYLDHAWEIEDRSTSDHV